MVSKKDFKKISDYLWEVPADFRQDMRVPARIYADDALLEDALGDESVAQLINTATLPGIVKHAIVMPDCHQGYGFPIGGVAATRLPHGIISPGGVGYDINCLSGDTLILHEHGYTRPIAEMADDWDQARLRCQNLSAACAGLTPVSRFLCQKPHTPVYRVITEAGDEITATADHPFWTPDGMVELERLRPGDRVALRPFEGVPFEPPDNRIILDEGDIERLLATPGKAPSGNALGQIIGHLKQRELLPLQTDAPALPYLLKMLGFVFGDGHLHFESGDGQGVTWFYGQPEDLEAVRCDVQATGFTPSRIYIRERHHPIVTSYDDDEFTRGETAFKVVGSSFAILLAALGAPVGNKATQDYGVPGWIEPLPLWQQRLFLASLFGAELAAPKVYEEHGDNFYPPILSMNKREKFVESGRTFLEGIARLLDRFDVTTTRISTRREPTHKDGTVSYRLRLLISPTPDNLTHLWGRVGFEYNSKKSSLANAVAQYLKHKQRVLQAGGATAQRAVTWQTAGVPRSEIYPELAGSHTRPGFIEHSLYGDPERAVRVGHPFSTFEEYCHTATAGLGQSGMVWERLAAIELVPDFDGDVYDFTVAHPDHNFIANGFVVSNCGVRLVGTHLDREELVPHVNALATALYHNCPSGVGEKGSIPVSLSELDELCVKGSQWALAKGYARPEDLPRTEEHGCLAGADPSKVSKRAKERGKSQVGTLGAGNHFIEVDEVIEIYDEEAAKAMGLFPGQMVAQIHCGSRGFGHQICTDYVAEFQEAIRKYKIELPDRELVCAPFDSPEGQAYFAAMACAANYAFANRQVLLYHIRRTFEQVLAGQVRDFDVFQIYDIAHNMAKIETHDIEGQRVKVCVHRKGATRAFGPGFEGLPPEYRDIGQPVLIPGSMGTASWVLVGTQEAMEQTFGSTCHGAGRVMSRAQAKKRIRGDKLKNELEYQGITIRAGSMPGLAEEAPEAYKDVDAVVEVVHRAGIARKVARLEPLIVVKG